MLLNAYGIKTRQVSYHKFNELERCDYLIKLLKKGDDIAIISDAGTPCISDPGDVIISQAHKENICITPIPGASSVISAICASGYAANGFKFIGFLPKKISQNIYNNNKELCIAKEISKIYEDIKIKKIDDWLNYFEKDNKEKLKGEFVFIIPASENNNEDYSENEIEEFIKFLIDYKISYSTALKIVCKRFKINKNDIYKKYIRLANK
jgi:16S rRNA (cytidine1402-2'-O)-methyltransferase